MPCSTFHHAIDSRRSSERAFTITEVVIAAVLLVLVSGAFLQLVVGSTQAQSAIRVQQRQQAVTESVLEKVRADTAWTDSCTSGKALRGITATILQDANKTCKIDFTEKFQGADFTKDQRGDLKFTVQVIGESVDSNADKNGPDDADGNTYDFFKITTTVTPPDGYGLKPRTTTSVIDPTSTNSAGVVDVAFCQLPEQTDDRMVITSCPRVADPVANPGIEMSKDGVDRVGLTDAEYAQVPIARRSVRVLPIANAPVSLVGVGKSSGTNYRNLRTGDDGRLTTSAIKPGQYKIEFALPTDIRSLKLWEEQSIADLTLNVLPFQIATGVVAYRVERAPDYAVRVERTRLDLPPNADPENCDTPRTKSYHLGIPRSVRIKLLPMPLGRAPIETVVAEQGEYDGVTQITRVTFKTPRPGLYSPFVVNSTGGLERLEHYASGTHAALNHVWVASGATTTLNVPRGVLTPQPGPADDASSYVTSEYVPPCIRPEEYEHDRIPEEPTCSYDTPYEMWMATIVDIGVVTMKPGPGWFADTFFYNALFDRGLIGAGTGEFNGSSFAVMQGKRYYEPSTVVYSWFQRIERDWRNCKSDCPDANIKINHEALGSRVNIFCGPESRCDQTITMDNGDSSFFQFSQNWWSAKGGTLNVYCLGDADCTQTATVVGSADSNFICYSGSNCKQNFSDPTGNWFSDQRGGSVTTECYDSSAANVCQQSTPLPARTHVIAACYPDSRCDQAINNDMPWSSTGNEAITIQCHRAGSCVQKLNPVLHLNMNGLANVLTFINRLFAGTKQGAIAMSCAKSASCAQDARLGKIDNGYLAHCYTEGSCVQRIYNATTLDFGFTKSSMASQECLPKATCRQEVVRLVATGSRNNKTSGLMQLCRTPPPIAKVVPVPKDTPTAACNQRNLGQTLFFRPLHVIGVKDSRQHCETKSTCTQDLKLGGFGDLSWFRSDYYTQYCASTRDCTQTLDRPYSLTSYVTDVNQLCERSEGNCKQTMNVDDNFLTNQNGWRRQMCDSAGTCTQFMASYSVNNSPFDGNWFENAFKSAAQTWDSVITSMLNKKNAVWQTCNVPVTEDEQGVVVVEEPSGDIDTSGGGNGGA